MSRRANRATLQRDRPRPPGVRMTDVPTSRATSGRLLALLCLIYFMVILVLAGAGPARAETYDFVTKWGSLGSGDGQFNTPYGVAVASNGSVYVADTLNNRIQRFNSSGALLNKWGPVLSGTNGSLNTPYAVAADDNSFAWVAVQGNSRILWFQPGGTLNGKCGSAGTADGKFGTVKGIAADASFRVYVADTSNNRIQVLNTVTCEVPRKWGSGGTGDGQFDHPSGIALDAAGNVYVADRLNYRIQVFDTQNNFVRKWGSAGTGDGQFSPANAPGSGGPTGIAVDPWGHVYVADPGDPGNNRIQVFSTTGQFVGKFGSTGSGDGQFFVNNGVATNAAGNIYVADTFNNRIQKFSAKEAITVLNRVSPANDPGHFDLKVNATTVKAGAGELDQGSTTVARGSNVTVSAVAAADTNQADYNTTIDCGAGPQAGTSRNLATVTADTTCTVINARPGAPPPPPPPAPPSGTTDAAGTITSSGAKLNGTANPNGGTVSTCRFDYGATTSYGQTGAGSTTPAGSSGTAVSAAVSGLSADTTYHYRLVVITNTGTLTASDASFKTALPGGPPSGSIAAATDVGSSSATLNATVNPQNESVSDCHFEYGTTVAYGQSVGCASTPSGAAPVSVSANAIGLTPGTEYHYRLVVSTSVPPMLETDDQPFTTGP